MPELENQLPFLEQAKFHVFMYIKNHLEKTDETVKHFRSDDVYVVWFSKTLRNWKALVSSSLPDGMYYEVTYNGNTGETYLDAYKKFENVLIPGKVPTHLEGTLGRALAALRVNGRSEEEANAVINELLNEGLLLRERK